MKLFLNCIPKLLVATMLIYYSSIEKRWLQTIQKHSSSKMMISILMEAQCQHAMCIYVIPCDSSRRNWENIHLSFLHLFPLVPLRSKMCLYAYFNVCTPTKSFKIIDLGIRLIDSEDTRVNIYISITIKKVQRNHLHL